MLDVRLKELRQSTSLSQKEFAAKIGVDVSKYNKWENGKNSPDLDTICRLADELNVTTDYLLGRNEVEGLTEKSANFIKCGLPSAFGLHGPEWPHGDKRTYLDVLNTLFDMDVRMIQLLGFIRLATSSKIEFSKDKAPYEHRAEYRASAHDILDSMISSIETDEFGK